MTAVKFKLAQGVLLISDNQIAHSSTGSTRTLYFLSMSKEKKKLWTEGGKKYRNVLVNTQNGALMTDFVHHKDNAYSMMTKKYRQAGKWRLI